jgi:FkbM family methyltransferase
MDLDDLLHDPLVLVDVGARGGIPDRWRQVAPWLRTLAFEPDARSLDTLDRSDRVTVLPTALAAAPGSFDFHLTAEESDSSILPPNWPFLSRFAQAEQFEVVETRTVEADTLDSQLAGAGIERVDAIKLDTQGSELAILQGARETLGRGVFGLEVEVELNPLYEEAALLADVDRFLRPLGYELFDLAPRRWKYRGGEDLALARGQLIWADATYLLDPDHALRLLTRDRDVGALARAVVVCLLYELGDYALALLDSLGDDAGPGRDRLVRAVRTYDATAKAGRHSFSTRVSSVDARRVHDVFRQTGIAPAKQLRTALRTWLTARDTRRP